METKCADEIIENSYLSCRFHNASTFSKPACSSVKKEIAPSSRIDVMNRNKTHIYFVDSPTSQKLEQIKRKNSYSGSKKFRQLDYILEPKSTPYQNRKKKDKLLFKDKQEASQKLSKIPVKLQESKDHWLIVKEAGSQSKKRRIGSQTSSERINIDISDILDEKREQETQSSKKKCIKTMLSAYKNKKLIKQSLQAGRQAKLTRTEAKQSINLKLSNLTEIKDSLKVNGLKDKFKCLYTSKKQKHHKQSDENTLAENIRVNLITSTHSDQPQASNKVFDGLLNSFKVNITFKEKTRPRTAQRAPKSEFQSPLKVEKKVISNKIIEMTGWENEPDKFERDFIF